MKRFFLVENAPIEFGGVKSTYMEVSYLCMSPAVVMVQKGNEFYLGETDNKDSFEFDVKDLKPITASIYGSLSLAVKQTAVKLVIFEYMLDSGKVIELNKYEDMNDGKMVASVSFDSPEEAALFEIPAWFGKEITTKKEFRKAGFTLKNNFYKK